MKKNVHFVLSLLFVILTACNKEDEAPLTTPIAVAFVNPSVNISTTTTPVNVVFSSATTTKGSLTLTLAPSNLVYGVDFTTLPAAVNNIITLPFEAQVTTITFSLIKLKEAIEGEVKNVKFTVSAASSGVQIPVSTSATQLNFNTTVIVAKTMSPSTGGYNVPNQVYIDLSSGIETAVERTKWDLGFYAGADFRLMLNGAIKMAVKKLDSNDITVIVTADPNVTVDNGDPVYADNPKGNIEQTAIAEVAINDLENKVYLLYLGNDLSNKTPGAGGVVAYGDTRGWKKIRVLRSGTDYKLQYANLEDTTYKEIVITKNNSFNFTFFSFKTNGVVAVEPEKAKWDLNFTSFTNVVNFGKLQTYSFQDFVVTNTKGGTRAYEVIHTATLNYSNFGLADVTVPNFEKEGALDQRAIGSNWRSGGGPTSGPSIKQDRFYVVKDVAGNSYKIRFITLVNANGERGNPSFEYALLK